MSKIKLYDTTLRDGAQHEGISFSVEDKLRITQRLDELGIHYIEGGWPSANPKDTRFFSRAKELRLNHAKLAAFGSTRHRRYKAEKDPNLRALLKAETPVVTIFGKSWDLHVTDVLEVTLEENLDLIYSSVQFLVSRVEEVIYDAEHFFDGYRADPEYAIKTLEAAQAAGAHCLALCDSNGGRLPDQVEDIIEQVKCKISTPLGIHAHNDSGVAVASSLLAIKHGVHHIQGTINGYGERCGNADLCAVIPNIKLKLNLDCITDEQLRQMAEVSWFVSELANMRHQSGRPYVGESAFTHKGGIHISAVLKNPLAYEHVPPGLIGNRQRILVSDQAGQGAIVGKAAEYNIDLTKDDPQTKKLLEELKRLEHDGFQFEGAEGSYELLLKRALGLHKDYFDLVGFRVIVEHREKDRQPISEATVKVRVKGHIELTVAEGNGPVNALDNALRKALVRFYPHLKEMELVDYKVRILDEQEGTQARTRVLIESHDGHISWGTVGVSGNIIEASWQALVDSVEYKLLKHEESHPQ